MAGLKKAIDNLRAEIKWGYSYLWEHLRLVK